MKSLERFAPVVALLTLTACSPEENVAERELRECRREVSAIFEQFGDEGFSHIPGECEEILQVAGDIPSPYKPTAEPLPNCSDTLQNICTDDDGEKVRCTVAICEN